MKSASFPRNNKKGFSLVELLLVLGVLAVLLVAAFVVYPRVRDANRANSEVSNLTAIKASINNLYASKGGNYTGLKTGVANQARVFPSSMNSGSYTDTAKINSSWGGEVTVTAPTTGALTTDGADIPAGRYFTVSYKDVPEGVCLGLVSGAAGNFSQIKVGSTDVIKKASAGGAGGAGAVTGGFDPSAAAGACTGTPEVIFSSN